MDQKQEIARQTVIEDEKPISTLAEKLKEQKRLGRKKFIKKIIGVVAGLFILYVMWFLFKPYKASAEYGICKTILELHVLYPHTIYVSELKTKRDGALELWYTYTDAFGGYRMEPFICRIGLSPKTGIYHISELQLHKINIDPERLELINKSMPYFMANPLIENWPTALPDSLADLQIEAEKFRRIQITPESLK